MLDENGPGAVKQLKSAKRLIGDVDAETASRLMTAAADVALVLDNRGVIRDIAFEDEDFSRGNFGDWLGRPWIDTVTMESRKKIEDLLKPKQRSNGATWRQVNHPTPDGADLPIKYVTVPIGTDGRVVAMGRNLRSFADLQQRLLQSQREAERELADLQSMESRYRAIFQLSGEAILVVDAQTLRVVEANPIAIERVGAGKRLNGRALVDLFDPSSTGEVQGMLGAARTAVKVDGSVARLAASDSDAEVSISLFRQDGRSFFLVRMTDRLAKAASGAPADKTLAEVVERLPDGFVVIDRQRRVMTLNTAFLQLLQLGTDEQARGQSIDRWLGRVDVDMDILLANLREHGSMRNFATIVRGEYGLTQDVVVSGVAVPQTSSTCFGLSVRRVERAPSPLNVGASITRSVEQLTALIGRTPLKDIVRETTDLIEKLCIEAALKLTNDNRASAAEVLGLSRQSLYIKLRRHGLGELDGQD
jgi:transcriptional regulator PpsR